MPNINDTDNFEMPLQTVADSLTPASPDSLPPQNTDAAQYSLDNDPAFNYIDYSKPVTLPTNDNQMSFQESALTEKQTIEGKPGFISGALHEASEWFMPWQVIKWSAEQAGNAFNKNAGSDYVPENWTPINEKAIAGIPEQYRGYIASAKSPADQRARRREIFDRMASEEYWDKTPWYIKLPGGLAGAIADPINKFLPAISFVRYGNIAQDVFINTAKNAPAIAVDTFARVSAQEINKHGDSVEDAALNMLSASVFGVALAGVGRGVGSSVSHLKLWESRKLAELHIAGVSTKVETDAKGIVTGVKAYPLDDSVGAARVKEAQDLIDNNMSKGGLFGLPLVGEYIEKAVVRGSNLPGIKMLAPPQLIMENSYYQSFKNFFNRIGFAGAITESESQGIARPISAEEISNIYKREAMMFNSFYKTKFYEANEINSSYNPVNAVKNLKQRISKNQRISEEDFGREVNAAMIREDHQSQYSQVHEVANELHKIYEKWGMEYQTVSQEDMFMSPRNAWRYFPFNYNIAYLKGNRGKFIEQVASKLNEQAEQVNLLKSPFDSTRSRISDINAQIRLFKGREDLSKAESAKMRDLQNQLIGAKKLLNRQHDDVVKKLRDNKEHHLLLENRVLFDSNEIEQLKKILNPFKEAQSKITLFKEKLPKTKKEIETIKSELKLINKEKPSKTRDNKIASREAKLAKLNKDIEAQTKKLKEWESRARQHEEKLYDDVIAGKIDEKFLKRGGGINFHDPDEGLKFRDIPSTKEEQIKQAEAWFEVLTNSTPEHILKRVIGKVDPNLNEGANYLSARTLMLPGDFLNDNSFLSTDVMASVSGYANTIGRLTGFKRAFPEFAQGTEFTGVIENLKKEHDQRLLNIENNYKDDNKKRLKEIGKAEREFSDTQKMMRDMYEIYHGTYRQSKGGAFRDGIKTLRNLVAASKLGAVPLYQMSEIGAVIMKHGAFQENLKFIRPRLESFKGLQNEMDADVLRKNAYNALVGINHITHGISERMMGGGRIDEIPIGTPLNKLANFTQGMAHVSSNLAGTNYIANILEMFTATKFQSNVMQAAFDVERGTLSQIDKQIMARYGIDIESNAKLFIEQYNNYGGQQHSKHGYLSHYYDWGDLNASRKMSEAIFRATEDTILKNGLYTSPLWTHDPIGGAIFMFHGWAYTAFNRYTMPLMQRGNAQHILGIMTMFGLSMFTEPALRFANGQDPLPENEEQWFAKAYKAFDYAGILGPLTSYFDDINVMTGLFPNLLTEKHKYREAGMNIPGPVGGYINDAWNLFYHAGLKGDLTSRDLKKGARLLPFVGMLPLRGGVNKFIDSLGLPETRREAEAYSWYPEANN
jgi:hypothetical protein